jgi:Phage tail-collar fibre protein
MSDEIPLRFAITDAGFNRLAAYLAEGVQAPISQVVLGDAGRSTAGGYVTEGSSAAQGMTALQNERLVSGIISGAALGNNAEIAASITTATPFWLNEIGLKLQDGTLFAVASRPGGYLYQNANITTLHRFVCTFAGIPPSSVTIILQSLNLNLFMIGQTIDLTRAVIKTMKHSMERDTVVAIATIQKTWR